MFLQFYRLREQPFGVTPNPRYLYHGPAHREALASLIYGIEADLGFAALIAEPGMGKTTLLYYLLERFRSSARTAFVFQTQCSRNELLRYLANELDVPAEETDAVVLNDRLREVLVQEARARRRVIVIIDEAQNLSEDALETVRLLSDFETPDAKLMHIILSGQPELAEKLARPSMAQLLQRIAMLNRLSPFGDAEQVSHYLAYRLQVAGYTGSPLFTPDAIELICRHTGGIPRQINRICFNALSLGCAMQERRIDSAIITEVIADLDVAALLATKPGIGYGRPVEENEPGAKGKSKEENPPGPPESKPQMESAGYGTPSRFTTGMSVTSAAHATTSRNSNAERLFPWPNVPLPQVSGSGALSAQPAVAPRPAIPSIQQRTKTALPRTVPVLPRPVAAVPHPVPAVTVPVRPAPAMPKQKRPQSRAAIQRPNVESDRRVSIRFVVLCALGVPLVLFAAWMYMEKEHLLPGLGERPALEETLPVDSGTGGDHGTSVTLPPPPDSSTPAKPKKVAPGPRSENMPPTAVPAKDAELTASQSSDGALKRYLMRLNDWIHGADCCVLETTRRA